MATVKRDFWHALFDSFGDVDKNPAIDLQPRLISSRLLLAKWHWLLHQVAVFTTLEIHNNVSMKYEHRTHWQMTSLIFQFLDNEVRVLSQSWRSTKIANQTDSDTTSVQAVLYSLVLVLNLLQWGCLTKKKKNQISITQKFCLLTIWLTLDALQVSKIGFFGRNPD